jgi:hypothetical protein
MKAGRELDARIAEIMGWKFIKPTHGTCCTCQNCGRDQDICSDSCHYSTDIAAAWEIVEKLKKQLDVRFEISILAMTDDKYGCEIENRFYKGEPDEWWSGWVATAPLAICLAVLAAKKDKEGGL